MTLDVFSFVISFRLVFCKEHKSEAIQLALDVNGSFQTFHHAMQGYFTKTVDHSGTGKRYKGARRLLRRDGNKHLWVVENGYLFERCHKSVSFA